MEAKYKFFEEKYNKILDLIEYADGRLADKYVDTISNLPSSVVRQLENGGKFKGFDKVFDSRLEFDGEMLEFDYTQYDKYLDVAIRMYPLFEEEFSDEFDELEDELEEEFEMDFSDMNQWFIFSLTKSNVKGVAKLKINYEMKDGKPEYVGTDINGVEIDYQVFLEKRDEDFFVMITKYLNGMEIYKKEVPIKYEELLEYTATWGDIDEDEEEISSEYNED